MRALLPAVAMVLVASAAHAHVADEIVVTLDPLPDGGFVERVTMTAETLAMLAPIDANNDGELTQADLDARADALRLGVWEQAKIVPCTRSAERASIEPGFVALTADFSCGPGELTQEFRWLMVLPSNYRVRFGSLEAHVDSRTVHLTQWTTVPVASVQFGSATLLFGALVALGLVGWRVRRLRWPAAGLALFALGFWLVHRLMT